MKIDMKELKKALARIEKHGQLTEVSINIVLDNKMVISYTEPMGGDYVTITLYDSATEKMGDITLTTRL